MIEIFKYSILSLFIIFFLGYGLTQLILPKQLKKYLLWLSPWILFISIIVFITLLSLSGLSTSISTLLITITLSLMTFYTIYKKNCTKIDIKRDLIITIFIFVSLTLNLSPLIKRDKFLTTISLGNNDVIAYTLSADYLKNNSIAKSFKENVILSIDNLIHDGFRWGPSINEAFFLNILNLEAYQYTYLFEIILYALMIPLVYILFEILFGQSISILIVLLSLVVFNANLLYMLYHNFFGLVTYWGISLFLMILLFIKYGEYNSKYFKFNIQEILISLTIAALYFSYHEGAIFILLPLFLYFIILFVLKKNYFGYFKSLFRIGLLSFLLGSISILNAFIFDFGQAFRGNPNQPIGWQLFRNKYPFANPFEMIGLYSIHNFDPLYNLVALVLSLLTIYIIFFGFTKSKYKYFLITFLITDLLFFYWMGLHKKNFFDFNRVVTYTLPIFLIIFSGGLLHIFKNKKYLKFFSLLLIFFLVFYSGIKINKRFISERVSVDKSFVSLKSIKNLNIKEPIYAGGAVDDSIPLWYQIWIGYFVYPSVKDITIPSEYLTSKYENKVPDNSLVLLQKPAPFINPTKLVLKNTIWENKFFKLGRVCNSTKCLTESKYDLSSVVVGMNDNEDSLMLGGWSIKEGDFRWSNSLDSTIRLVTKTGSISSKLVIEAYSLAEPQKIQVYINGIFIGEEEIISNWSVYSFDIPIYLEVGVQKIDFKFSNLYKPVDLGLSLDMRDLSVNFRKIALE